MREREPVPLSDILRRVHFHYPDALDISRLDHDTTRELLRRLANAAHHFNLVAVSDFGGRIGRLRGEGMVKQVIAAAFQGFEGVDPHPDRLQEGTGRLALYYGQEAAAMAMRGRVRFKAGDIWDAPDDQYRYEVIDGELFMTPAPSPQHQRGVSNLHGYLWQHVRRNQLGEVFPAPIGVVLDDENGVQPDIVYVSRERLHIVSERGIEGPPDLVVEVLSPGTEARDRGVKLRRYAAAGVPHYWLLDPRTKSLEPYRLGQEGYELTERYGPGTVFRPELFPGLEIFIDDLWI